MAEWIPVLVRAEDYPEITALVAQREAVRACATDDAGTVDTSGQRRPVEASQAPTGLTLSGHPMWEIGDLQRLARGDTLTTQRWTRAMDVCAASPGVYLTTSQVAEAADMSVNEWRDACRKITRHLKAHYPGVPRDANGEPVWPLHDWITPDSPAEVSWAITDDTARLWQQVRGG